MNGGSRSGLSEPAWGSFTSGIILVGSNGVASSIDISPLSGSNKLQMLFAYVQKMIRIVGTRKKKKKMKMAKYHLLP